ncbi:MAG: hypothetical protein ACRD2X_25010 [Vicinamibacteraceae bacterium]
MWFIAVLVVAVAAGIGALLMNIISEGALIEGVSRGDMTVREGMRLGWSHFGVVLRIKLLVFAAGVLSVALLSAPGWLFALGLISGLTAALVAVPAVLVGVPWLITLYVVYAFALRIAVLENRHASDAIHKARLFLHGRVLAGVELIVAMAVGQVGVTLVGVLALLPVAAVAAALYVGVGRAAGRCLVDHDHGCGRGHRDRRRRRFRSAAMFEAWWAFAEAKAAGFTFLALAIAVIAANEARTRPRATPVWASSIAAVAGVASFAGWALGVWPGIPFGNLLWVASSFVMCLWTVWFGLALMRTATRSNLAP